jgi:hypothetical protein
MPLPFSLPQSLPGGAASGINTSVPWDIVDYNGGVLSSLLGLGPSDLSLAPGAAPYFTYTAGANVLTVQSSDGVTATADFNVAIPASYTIEFVARFPSLPNTVADLASHHVGIQLADDAGRGVAIYFAQTGMAFSRIDDFGSVSPIPDSTSFTAEIARYFHRVRVAVSGDKGRAYVYIGRASDPFPPLRVILPVEPTPPGVTDRFRLTVAGSAVQPVLVEYNSIQLAGSLLIPNMPPTASAGTDRVIFAGNTARLDGRASFDPEGAPLTYQWRAKDAPYGSEYAADISSGSTVDDGDTDAVTNTLSFTPNALPAWVAQDDVLVIQGTLHDIDTIDNSGGSLTVRTDTIPDNLTGMPFRIIRQSVLVGAETETPYVVPDIPGIYRFGLVVDDGEAFSEESEVLVSVVGARAPMGVEPRVEAIWNALGDDWKLVEGRDVFTEFWRGTAQILGARLLEVWQHQYNMSLRDAQSVFQKKWIALRTLIPETDYTTVSISPRYGKLEGTHNFNASNPAVTGATMVFEFPRAEGTFGTLSVTLTGNTITQIRADLDAALAAYDIVTYESNEAGYRLLGISSPSAAFRLGLTSTAAIVLGIPTGQYNHLSGVRGARVTEDTYRVDTGVDLVEQGVVSGDLLVLNNGQSFRIDRVLNDPRDSGPNQRLLLRDPLPFDATVEWVIPSIVRSTEVNYEREGAYPGDLVKIETYDAATDTFVDVRGTVVSQHEMTLGVHLDGVFGAIVDGRTLRLLGVKRRRGVTIPEDVVSIPRLQDIIPQVKTPTIWKENIDYFLEPFYRDDLEQSIPTLQFRDDVFVTPDEEPPEVLWAELVLFKNDQNIENLFGRLAGFLREDAEGLGEGFSYLSGVSGIMYARQRGPTPYAMRVGAQILFGQPFAEVSGYITEIRSDYSPEFGRMLVQDDDGNVPTRSEIVRSYIYRKDPLDLTSTSGLEVNPSTLIPYAVGDYVRQFTPIGTGIRIEDYKNNPTWFIPFLSSGLLTELEKFFYFLVRFNLDLVTLVNLSLIHQLIYRIKPTYSHPIMLGAKILVDDVDVVDSLDASITLNLFDTTCGVGRAFMYDDYRGDGTIWSAFDDGTTYYDGYVDCPSDWIQFYLELSWAGGAITYDSIFFINIDVVDVDGAHTGTPGNTFTATYDMTLPAGTYGVEVIIDAGNMVNP